jgi:hypothetical protein
MAEPRLNLDDFTTLFFIPISSSLSARTLALYVPFSNRICATIVSVLALLIFTLFFSFELDTCPGVRLGNLTFHLLLYTDDLFLVGTSADAAQ